MATKYEENADYSTSNVSSIYDDKWIAQTFTPSVSHSITRVKLVLGKALSPGDLTVSIRATDGNGQPTGSDLASGTQVEADIPTVWSGTQVFVDFSSPATLIADTKYAIVCRALTGDVNNKVNWYKKTSDVYAGGNVETSTDSGAAWSASSSHDAAFEEWGIVGTPVDRVVTKKLVAVAGNSLFYEDSAGSLTALTASAVAGQLNSTEQLEIFEAFQKVVVVNGANLKIADFINTKIDLGSGNELTDPPAKGDILTQATSAATMVVDFVDSTKRYIYGFTTSGTFVTTGGYTLTSNDGIATMNPGTAPKPDVVSEASTTPHWYDYTTYPDIVLSTDGFGQASGSTKSFGSLPSKAYIGCLYRGRVALGGNPNYPHQWYMSRQAYLSDYAYLANDAQSPVVGNNADAGEIGDVLISLIPYKDDYLIFGCASSMWVLRGDATAGGSLNEIDLTVGIFGATSWCFDGAGNLYFWGTEGIYIMPVGFGEIRSLTENTLPNLITDENVNPTTHRISLGYERERKGILVSIVAFADGSNSNYWYDLRTGGFFPESYPDECGPYALFYYAANDKTFSDLIIGCQDGYVRKFLDSAKSDDKGATDKAIDSYCTLPIQPMSIDGDHLGRLTSLTVFTAGGRTGGAFGDTDQVTCSIFAANSAETILEDIIDGDTPKKTRTFTGSGIQKRFRARVRGGYLGIKLSDSTANKTWAIEKIEGNINLSGRIK